MDIEQLKLVLETVQHTTDGAKSFGVWWIALHYCQKILEGIFIVACVWGVTWGIIKAITMSTNNSDDTHRLQGLREMMRIGSAGIVTPSEYDQMRDKIRSLMEQNNG
jgi:hypothetical protein